MNTTTRNPKSVLSFLTGNLRYGKTAGEEQFPVDKFLSNCLTFMTEVLEAETPQRVCFILPAREELAYWMAFIGGAFILKAGFEENHSSFRDKFKDVKTGDKLKLNNSAVVEFCRFEDDKPVFKSCDQTEFTLWAGKIENLQPYLGPKGIDNYKKIAGCLPKEPLSPVDKLLDIRTKGNKLFYSDSITLVSRSGAFTRFLECNYCNNIPLADYFKPDIIGENWQVGQDASPITVSGELLNLEQAIKKGYSPVLVLANGTNLLTERLSELDRMLRSNLHILIIADLNDSEDFQYLADRNFRFYNWHQDIIEPLIPKEPSANSPFGILQKKLNNFCDIKTEFITCRSASLEKAVGALLKIPVPGDEEGIRQLKSRAVILLNKLSGIFFKPNEQLYEHLLALLNEIQDMYSQCMLYTGEYKDHWAQFFQNAKIFIEEAVNGKNDKAARFRSMTEYGKNGVVILSSVAEAESARETFNHFPDGLLFEPFSNLFAPSESENGVIPYWLKYPKVKELLVSFNFRSLTFFYYPFEISFHRSRMNRCQEELICTGQQHEHAEGNADFEAAGYTKTFTYPAPFLPVTGSGIIGDADGDIHDPEWLIEETGFPKYHPTGDRAESLPAYRVDFHDGSFMFCTVSHKLLFIETAEPDRRRNCQYYRVKDLKSTDIVGLIDIDETRVGQIVSDLTNSQALGEVKAKISLWKNCLYRHYEQVNRELSVLCDHLKAAGCKRGRQTIRNWLFDTEIIGPRDDNDLQAIGKLTQNRVLATQTKIIRKAIIQMKSWRRKAFNKAGKKIRIYIQNKKATPPPGSCEHIEGLGEIGFQKIVKISRKVEETDVRYINKLLQKNTD